jgi:hypothetical protein
MSLRPREIILMAIFIGLAIAGGLVMAQIPNVELITAVIFLSGMMLGMGRGIIVGAVAEFLYSFFNPYGAAAPPLLIAQIISMTLVGATGGLIQNWFGRRIPPAWLLGILGFILTFIFDLLTTLSFTLVAGLGFSGFLTAAAFGLYFYVLHQISNTLIFALLLPICVRQLRHLPFFNQALPMIQSPRGRVLQPSLRFEMEKKS